MLEEKPLWDHQRRGIEGVQEAIRNGHNGICLTSPTGGGKTRQMIELIRLWRSEGHRVALYTNRRMLMKQTVQVLEGSGIEVGVRASGYKPAYLRDVQVCMSQTEQVRVYAMETRELHDASRVLVDEAHIQKSGTMERIIEDHKLAGAVVVGVTATPLDIGHLYDELVVAGVTSELRGCGALLPCHTYAPDEPDLRHVKKYRIGDDLSERDNAKAMMRPGVFARVYNSWRTYNPEEKPTIGFGPDVAGSLYLAEQFYRKGVPAAHIDGEDVWVNGRQYKSSQEARDDVLEDAKNGEIKIVFNRYCLREGIDMPWLSHAIFATVFGSLSSYLQAGGRLLRSHPTLTEVVLIDHGGNYWRHGSLNADRHWNLNYTSQIVSAMRLQRIRDKKDPEPIVCPKCFAVRLSGPTCPKCNHQFTNKSRMVVQVDGTLKEMRGDIVKPRRVKMESNTQHLWDKCYYGARRGDRSFAQAEAWFFQQHHYWPPRTLRNMPKSDVDWYRPVKNVPTDELIGGDANYSST